jgi:hypothetical protein
MVDGAKPFSFMASCMSSIERFEPGNIRSPHLYALHWCSAWMMNVPPGWSMEVTLRMQRRQTARSLEIASMQNPVMIRS